MTTTGTPFFGKSFEQARRRLHTSPPQKIELKHRRNALGMQFEDGGVTPYNNPAYVLYRMATLPEYNCQWPDGEGRMMLVSVGTGCAVTPEPHVSPLGRFLWSNARSIPSALMQRISTENDINCRTIGRCVFGAEIDREIGDLTNPLSKTSEDTGRRFLYARYDPDVTDAGLTRMGLAYLTGRKFAMDDISKDQLDRLSKIGAQYARSVDIRRDFGTFMPKV